MLGKLKLAVAEHGRTLFHHPPTVPTTHTVKSKKVEQRLANFEQVDNVSNLDKASVWGGNEICTGSE